MPNAAYITFNKGELSPKVDVRADTDAYSAGCRRLENMIPTRYGCAEKRPGFQYVATAYNTTAIESDTIKDYYNTGDDEARSAYGDIGRGQTFTATVSFVITRIKLLIYRGGSPGTVRVSIYDVGSDDGVPDTELTYVTFDGDTLTTDTDGEWYEINFTTQVTLTKGSEYAIVMLVSDGDASNYVDWRRDSAGTYDGGGLYSTDGGLYWELYPDLDFMFETYGTQTTPIIRMIPFVYSADIAYQCEFGDGYVRFYYDDAVLLNESDAEVVIDSPYAEADLFELKYYQIGDTMWILHPSYKQRKLTRTSVYSFSIDEIDYRKGPFLTRNDLIDPTSTTVSSMTCSVTGVGVTGTLTCNADYFYEEHVGSLFKLWHPRENQTLELEGAGTTDSIGGQGTYNLLTRGTWYGEIQIQRQESASGWTQFRKYKSSSNATQNVSVSFEDDSGDYKYRLYSDASAIQAELDIDDPLTYGIVRVTEYVDSRTVNIIVLNELESTDATKRWAEGAWNDLRGYPGAITFFEDRCVQAGTVSEADILESPTENYIAIRSIQELKDIENNLAGQYELLLDLDLSAEDDWTPIGTGGTGGTEFTGILNGRGHTIKNLTLINDSAYSGLFGYANSATISNLFLEGFNLTVAGNRVGALCGEAAACTIEDVHADGVTITSGYTNGILIWTGGLCGISSSDISRCSVENLEYICDDFSYVGGLCGSQDIGGDIVDCYAIWTTTEQDTWDSSFLGVGGLLGELTGTATVTSSYASYDRPNDTGWGFVGSYSSSGGFTNCFWDTTVTGTSNGVDGGNESGCTGKTTTEMYTETTYTSWDFTDVWGIDEGNYYPYLQAYKSISSLSLWGGRVVWFSSTGDYENYQVGTYDADSFSIALPATTRILWISAMEGVLCGTGEREYLCRSNKLETPITPTSFTTKQQTTFGSRNIQPVVVNSCTMVVDHVGRKLREMVYNYTDDKYLAPDMTSLAEHITESGIVCMDWQKNPDSTIWCVLDDGTLLSMVYDRDQGVTAWSSHPMTNGAVQSVSVSPGTDEDDVWISVTRTIEDKTIVHIEKMASRTTQAIEDSFYVDGGITVTGTSATITGLDHLEGETVAALVDGVYDGTYTVSSGSITTTTTPTGKTIAGLPITAVLQPMQIIPSSNQGSGLGSLIRIHELKVVFLNTAGAQYGDSESNLFSFNFDDERLENANYISGLFSGIIPVKMSGSFSMENPIIIYSNQPLPMTVKAIVAGFEQTGV